MSIGPTANFVVEAGRPDAKVTGVHESLLQESEKDIIFYKEFFVGKGARRAAFVLRVLLTWG